MILFRPRSDLPKIPAKTVVEINEENESGENEPNIDVSKSRCKMM